MSEQTTFAPKLPEKLAKEHPELLPVVHMLDRDDTLRNAVMAELLIISLSALARQPLASFDSGLLLDEILEPALIDSSEENASALDQLILKNRDDVDSVIAPYIKEYWRGRYERFWEWATASARDETPPETALKPEEVTPEDIIGFLLFGCDHPHELQLFEKAMGVKANQHWGGKEYTATWDLYFLNEGDQRARRQFDVLKAGHGHSVICELDEMPEHLKKALARGDIRYGQLYANTKELSGILSTIFTVKPMLPHIGHELRGEKATELKQAEERLAEIKSDPNFLYHPFVTLRERDDNGSKDYDSIFFGLLTLGEDEWAQTILDEGYRADALNGNQDACCRFAVDRCSLKTMQKMHDAGFDFTQETQGTDSLLFTAIKNRDPEKLKQLLEWGCATGVKDNGNSSSFLNPKGSTLLTRAFRQEPFDEVNAEIILILLANGAGSLQPYSDEMNKDAIGLYDQSNKLTGCWTKDSNNYPHIERYQTTLLEKFTHFIANAEALRDPYGDGWLPHLESPSPLNLSRQDVIDFYSIGKLPEALQEKYWAYKPERRDDMFDLAFFSHDALPRHIYQIFQKDTPARAAEISRTAPPKPLGSWTAAVTNAPQVTPERARA